MLAIVVPSSPAAKFDCVRGFGLPGIVTCYWDGVEYECPRCYVDDHLDPQIHSYILCDVPRVERCGGLGESEILIALTKTSVDDLSYVLAFALIFKPLTSMVQAVAFLPP